MEDFSLILKEILKKDIEKIKIDLSPSLKEEFEKTAEAYIKRGLVLEAIKTLALTKNSEKLIQVGQKCLTNSEVDFAFKAFYFAKDKEGLSKAGEEYLRKAEIQNALLSFKLAENKEMTDFIEQNF